MWAGIWDEKGTGWHRGTLTVQYGGLLPVQRDSAEKDRQAEEMMRQMEAEYEEEIASLKVHGA